MTLIGSSEEWTHLSKKSVTLKKKCQKRLLKQKWKEKKKTKEKEEYPRTGGDYRRCDIGVRRIPEEEERERKEHKYLKR